MHSHWTERAPDEIDLADERQEELVREFALQYLGFESAARRDNGNTEGTSPPNDPPR